MTAKDYLGQAYRLDQHINDRLLRAMNRRGDSRMIRRLLDACRERGIVVRTTMIVGFPGETEE